MINDSSPYWGRTYQVSASGLDELRRRWADAGREAWNAATRMGRDVQARTQQELEALGRQVMQEQQARSDQSRGMFGVLQAASPLMRNFNDMKEANWKGGDKYFHCKGNCEAAQRGSFAEDAAVHLANGREVFGQCIKHDPLSDEIEDQSANRYGRARGRADPAGSCSALCGVYRPQGLPEKY